MHSTTSSISLIRHLLCLLLLLLPSNLAFSQSSMDPPHDPQGCKSCHDMSAFDQPNLIPNPSAPDPYIETNIDDTIYNQICNNCHFTGPATIAYTHSSLTTSNNYGDWSVGCSVCHNQHTQQQPGNKFIRTTIDLSKIAGTVKDTNGDTVSKTGRKQVKFTGSSDFANGDATYDGICEVCHTQTNYHRNTSLGGHAHYQGQNCIPCHSHDNGFVHGGGGSGSDCITCHGHDVGYEYEPGKFSQGKGTFKSHSIHTENDNDDKNGPYVTCTVCHDTGNFPFFISGNDGNGDSLFNLAETNVCYPCHNDATGIATGSLTLKTPPEWNTTSLTCTGCHDIGPAYANNSPKANSHPAHSGFPCNSCHASTTNNGTNINDQSVHPNGLYTLQADTGITFSYTFNASGGTCTNISCHGNQNATWGTTLACDSCHSYPPVPGDGKDINEPYDGGKGAHITSWDSTGPWGRGGHIIYPASLNPTADIYGDTSTGYNECYKCHKDGTHANGTVDVMIIGDPWSTITGDGPYDRPNGFGLFGGQMYLGIPGDISTPKTCSNIICHQGDTPRWSCVSAE